MNTVPDRNEGATAKAARELVRLRRHAEQARAVLVRLQRDVVAVENRPGRSQVAQIVEANEQLVFATLRAQTEAETAIRTLEQVSRSAKLDPLTELPNRAALLDRFASVIATTRRCRTPMALLFLDLNNFQQINGMLGHAVGDQVLKMAAHRLASSVGESDMVSHYSGDKFLILLTELSSASDAIVAADKLIAALGTPSRMGDHVLRLTASIGISIYPDDGGDADTLIDRADAAMYRAKQRGLGSLVFHAEKPESPPSLTLPILESLRPPLAHYELAQAEHERRHEELREANEQLVLAALSAQELQAAAEQAQQHQTRILAMLAHELRNPLTPIRNAAALLNGIRTDESLLPRVQAVIERQVKHMSRMVDDLFDVSRINTGKLRLERRVVEMVGIIDEAVDTCRPAMDTRLQHFSVQVPSCVLEMEGDPVRLAQILSNLLDNASKYTQDGGEIRLSVMVVDDAIKITVSDSGIGISTEMLPTIFEPFVQDAHATGFNGEGLGIGLTVVRELVEAHGGSVVVSSAGRGHGSEFVVTFPLNGYPAFSKSETLDG